MRPFTLVILFFSVLTLPLMSQISHSEGSIYKFLKAPNAASLPSNWMNPGFDDSAWPMGVAPFRYGDGEGGTQITDMRYNYSVLYFRGSFNAFNAHLVTKLTINTIYDDGFILWINGTEVLRKNAPAIPANDAFAPSVISDGVWGTDIVSVEPGILVEGKNTLAVQGFNVNLESSDFYFDVSISADAIVPEFSDSLGLIFSHESGFYDSPFGLSISHPDPEVRIYYTLDGTNPQDLVSGREISSGTVVSINPASAYLRPLTPAVTLRAAAFKDGIKPSKPVARTFIFLDKVKTQTNPGGDWPEGNVDGQLIDLDMDSRIINHSSYSGQIEAAFKDIPSISIITNIDHLFDPTTGIYVNAMGHGTEWERECSAELIFADGQEGFNVNAGLRIRGGWSRHDYFPKHAFRLLFKSEYGNPKLYYPLFGDEGVKRFDNIDLRTAQNYAWSNGDNANTMVREVFSRDLQRDMGHPYTRSRYYHLYLNGMYWGLFQTQERSEASYASDYLGGETEDYDVVKISTDLGYINEATDGNTDAWRSIYQACNYGFVGNSAFFSLLGKNHLGQDIAGGTTLLELDNFIDYMISIFYTGNFDAPVSAFSSNYNPNNFYAIYNREYKAEGFRFFNHDAEHSLFSYARSPGTGLNENRVNIGSLSDGRRMNVTSFEKFQPQWLHFRLTDNAEYRQKFIDRAWLHLSEGGTLSPEKNEIRLNERVAQIDKAIIAESAKWGDSRRNGASPYTRNDNWIPEINKVLDDYFPFRTAIVEEQLDDEGLYTPIDPPEIFVNNVFISPRYTYFTTTAEVKLSNPNGSNELYYTTDGSDPRKVGGTISENATKLSGSVFTQNLTQTSIIKSRTYKNGVWSALKEVAFLKENEDYNNLHITELNFHPLDKIVGTDTIEGKKFEFIEFKNTGNYYINLSGLRIDSAVEYTFPENTILAPNDFYVIVSKPTSFYNHYKMKPDGNYQGFLENLGEEFIMFDRNDHIIMHFAYSIEYPWPAGVSGTGKTMVPTELNPVENPAHGWYWTSSVNYWGSPFADEGEPNTTENLAGISSEISIYPNPARDYVNIDFSNAEQAQNSTISIFSMEGKLVFRSGGKTNMTLPLSTETFSKGVYIIRIHSNDRIQSSRLIIR